MNDTLAGRGTSYIHDYEESLEAKVRTYSLEEIIAEKLRAVLQQTRTLRERGWTRSRARDYYDIWRILRNYRSQLVSATSVPC